jgi:hypothetical protein
MPLLSRVGSYTEASDTNNQAVTGIGFQPKVVIFLSNTIAASGAADGARMMIGAATSSTNRFVVYTLSGDAQTSSDVQRAMDNTKVNTFIDAALAVVDSSDFVSLDADGFTIDRVVNDSVGRVIDYFAIGGSTLTNVNIVQITSSTSLGSVGYTGAGFQPDAVILVSVGDTGTPPDTSTWAFMSIGIASSAADQAVSSWYARDGVTTMETEHSQATGSIYHLSFGGASVTAAALESFDADGFTLNWTDADDGLKQIWAICLKGGRYKVGEFLQRTTTGNSNITDVGFRPQALWLQSNADANNAIAAHAQMSLSVIDNSTTRKRALWLGDEDAVGDSDTKSYRETGQAIVIRSVADGTELGTADITGYRADGFRLNWSATDGTARRILYLAMGETSGTGQGGGGQGGGGGNGGGGGGGNGGGNPGGGGPPGGNGGGQNRFFNSTLRKRRKWFSGF